LQKFSTERWGFSHHDYIDDEILHPLGLTNTYNLYSEVDSSAVMSGYFKGYDPDLKSIDHTRPGGSMVATAEDVGIFLRALIDGTLFNTEEQEIYSDIYEYEHTGWINGYTSIARYHSDIDAVVVQFVNTSSKEWFWIELERVYSRIVRSIEKEL
jgi:D-alanyl-D-alanine carboxypeptidase